MLLCHEVKRVKEEGSSRSSRSSQELTRGERKVSVYIHGVTWGSGNVELREHRDRPKY